MRIRHIAAGLLIIAGTLGGWAAMTAHSSAETAIPYCPTGMAVTKPFNGSTVSSIVTLEATAQSSYNVNAVSFKVKDQFVFNAEQLTAPYWRASFDSRNADLGGNGTYPVYAVIHYSGTTANSFECRTPTVAFNVNNPPTTNETKALEIVPSLTQWTGPTNVTFDVVMKASLVSASGARTDVTPQASYEWSVTKGVLSPQGYRASVNSGPSSGDGAIRIRVTYAGQAKEVSIPMKVQSYTQSSTYPTSASPTTNTTNTATSAGTTKPPAGTTTSEQPKTIQEADENGLFQTALSSNGQGDAELERCLTHTLGEKEYQQRIKQQPRLRFGEIAKTEQCFVRRNLVVPSNLAPIEPTKVKDLPVSSKVKLEKFEKVTKNGKDALEIKGTAKPDQMVIIYIFSEPLVLVAKADGDGKWTYVLEDPMEPGNHEAFVTVEGEGGQEALRSGGFGFAIAAAPKTNLNPLGLSFAVQQSDKPKLFYGVYITSAVAAIAVAILLSHWVIRHRAGAAAAASSQLPLSAEPIVTTAPQQPVTGTDTPPASTTEADTGTDSDTGADQQPQGPAADR